MEKRSPPKDTVSLMFPVNKMQQNVLLGRFAQIVDISSKTIHSDDN